MSEPSEPVAADPPADRPAHLDENTRALASLHAEHYDRLPTLGRALDGVTRTVARPGFVLGLVVVTVGWIALNVAMRATGYKPLDPPPFNYLEAAGTAFAVVMTCLILSTQRRENQLMTRRDQLTLELSLLAEQKASKTIELLEALRRDSPILKDRPDIDAGVLATPSDPRMILEAIQEARPDLDAAAGAP